MIPGELQVAAGEIELNSGRNLVTVTVANTGDRPVQIGSHYHFYEVNEALRFDRERARGCRLNIASGTAVRFEPGESKTVTLVEIAGNRVIRGGNSLASGPIDESKRDAVKAAAIKHGFGHEDATV